MHRAIGFLSKRFVQLRPGEGKKVALTFLYFFLIITAYYVIKPVSRSLVLGELGSHVVPYVDLVCALVMGPVVTVFAKLVDRVPKPRLVTYAFWTVTGILLVFWKLVHWPLPWVAGAFYIWVSIFSVLVVTLFWLVANDLYRPRDAKRLFGLIGSGGILGGIVGSSLAAVGAQVVGTEHLLLLSAGILIACWLVVQRLWRFAPEQELEGHLPAGMSRHEAFLGNVGDFVRLLCKSRYLLLLVTLVAVNKLVATLVYYQLNPFIEHAFPNQDARTTFTGMFLGGVNIAAFIIQFFFTSWVLRRWDLLTALLVWPTTVLCGSTALILLPVFGVAAWTELCDASLNYSLQQTAKEVLYLPIDRSIRYKVKPFIDMVMFRVGKGTAAVLGIVLLDVLHLAPAALSYVTVPLLVLWIFAAIRMRHDYVATIRTMLQARAAAVRAKAVAPSSAAATQPLQVFESEEIDPFLLLTHGHLAGQKLSLVQQLVTKEGPPSGLAKELVADLTDYEVRAAQASALVAEARRLKEMVRDPHQSMANRCQAIRLLVRFGDQDTVDYLFAIVMLGEDAPLRQEAVQGLIRLRLRGMRLDFPVPPIHRQITNEVANYQRIRHVAAVYRQHHRGSISAEDPVLALLRVLLEESVDQVFRLLMLIYHPEDIHLAYEQLRASETYVRADAIELLDNLVDPFMRATLLPILDEDRFLSMADESGLAQEPTAAYQVLQEAIWDHNCWLSVTTLCAVGRLRLTTMRPELEKAAAHRVPLISTAAKVALHLAAQP